MVLNVYVCVLPAIAWALYSCGGCRFDRSGRNGQSYRDKFASRVCLWLTEARNDQAPWGRSAHEMKNCCWISIEAPTCLLLPPVQWFPAPGIAVGVLQSCLWQPLITALSTARETNEHFTSFRTCCRSRPFHVRSTFYWTSGMLCVHLEGGSSLKWPAVWLCVQVWSGTQEDGPFRNSPQSCLCVKYLSLTHFFHVYS